MKKVFGLNHLSKRVNELLIKDVKHKHEPENWKWTPYDPGKIRNLKKIVEQEKEEVNYGCITNYTPAESPQKVILVFAIGNLSYGFVNHFMDRKIKFVFLDYAQFILQGEIKISIGNDKQIRQLAFSDVLINLDDISVVIWNGPKQFKPLFDFECIPGSKGRNKFLFKKRWLQFLRELPLLLNEDTVWIPGKPLNGSQEWQNKLGEYNLARHLGFHVPPTIFTNSIADLKQFYATYGSDLVIREFSSPPFSFPPIRINAENITLQHFRNSPSCFQKYVDKIHEFRMVVLFDKVFACKIHSQNSELAKNDWRVYDDENVKWELAEIPVELHKRLVLICQKLDLNWCSVDMIYGKDHQYYFLEINRPGAHYWLHPFIGLDITKEITDAVEARNLVEKCEA